MPLVIGSLVVLITRAGARVPFPPTIQRTLLFFFKVDLSDVSFRATQETKKSLFRPTTLVFAYRVNTRMSGGRAEVLSRRYLQRL